MWTILTHVINYGCCPMPLKATFIALAVPGGRVKPGVAISIVTPLEKYKLRQIEKHTKQSLEFTKNSQLGQKLPPVI